MSIRIVHHRLPSPTDRWPAGSPPWAPGGPYCHQPLSALELAVPGRRGLAPSRLSVALPKRSFREVPVPFGRAQLALPPFPGGPDR